MFVSSGSLAGATTPRRTRTPSAGSPTTRSEGKIIGQYVKENMPDAKVGLFLQDDDFGRDGEKGVRQFIDDQVVAVAAVHLGQHRRRHRRSPR